MGEESMASFSRVLFAVFVCFTSLGSFAQDPTKVEPKHYKLDFENDKVQVVSVHYGPHEKSAMHEHPGGVVVVLTEAHLRFKDEKGKVREVYSKPGEARWYPPFRHEVENLGDTPYDAVYVGIKGTTAASNSLDGLDEETRKIVEQLMASAKQ
jgi:quercetin dioxygenase-like cupin family protein